jgi:anti-sigma-K factor RskA
MDPHSDHDRPEFTTPMLVGLAQIVPQIEPPPSLRERVMQSVGARVNSVARASVPRPWWLWVATAASCLVAVGMAIHAGQLRARIRDLEISLRDARQLLDVRERQVADAERSAAGAQTMVSVLSAPDVARIDLAGQTVAPQASGRVFWSRSRGMTFTAANLPPLAPGRTYQLWVVTAGPAPISVGFVDPDPQGGVTQVFSTPADLPQPVAVAVTNEPEGGVPAPTGQQYLVGTL